MPADVPVYTWNLVGYRLGHGPSGTANRHTFAGLLRPAFTMIPLLERGHDAPVALLSPVLALLPSTQHLGHAKTLSAGK